MWIFCSDIIVSAFAEGTDIQRMQTVKGWLFVIVSSALIYSLTKRDFRNQEKAETAKEEIFRSTVGASDHIMLNYLNQMQLVMMEAERCKEFDPEVYQLAKLITSQTVDELKRLEQVRARCPADIEAFLKGRLRETRETVDRIRVAVHAP